MSDVNLVDALFETDLHKLRRSFECEDSNGVPITTFVWILATTIPLLRPVISTFSEKHESDYGRRKRQFSERHPSPFATTTDEKMQQIKPNRPTTTGPLVRGKVDMAKIIAGNSADKKPTILLSDHNPLYSSSNNNNNNSDSKTNINQRRRTSPLPYATTEPTEINWSSQDRERGKRLRANLEALFIAMDVDGDAKVTWDELYSYTVNTTMHRLTVKPADVVRLYGVAKQTARQDNVVCVRHFDSLNAIGISSRHESMELLDATSLRIVARTPKLSQFDQDALIKSTTSAFVNGGKGENKSGDIAGLAGSNDMATTMMSQAASSSSGGGGGHHSLMSSPTITKMCYVDAANVIVAAADNLRLYCYSVMNGGDPAMIVKGKKIPGTQYRLNPICSESIQHSVTQLRIAPSAPQLAFASLSSGELSCYEVFDVHRPRLRYKFPLHSAGSIVSDFCFMSPTDHKIVSTSYDKTVRITDLHLQGEGHEECHWVVGEPDHACTHVTYAASHELIVTASVDCQVRAWTAHSTRTPATLLFDSTNPHTSKIVGLFQIQSTPQLISCDEAGLVKVWDLRNFRCAQSLVVGAKQTEVVDEAEIRATGGISRSNMAEMLGEQQVHRNLAVNDICYINGKQSFCCVGPSKVSLHKYDAGANPNLATESFVVGAQILADQNAIVMVSPQELTAWDVTSGSISASVAEPTWERDDFSCIVCDHSDRRVLAGTRSGKILMWSAVGLNRIQSHVIRPHSSQSSSETAHHAKKNSRSSSPTKKSSSSSPHHQHGTTTTAAGVTGVGYCAAQNTIISIGTDGFMQIQRLEANATSLTASRYLIGSGIPLCALSVSDACATVACGDDTGNLFICDAFVISGQPVLFRTKLSAAVVSTAFCGNFPMVVISTCDGWCYLYTCRPAPDGLLLAKWRVDDSDSDDSLKLLLSKKKANNSSNKTKTET